MDLRLKILEENRGKDESIVFTTDGWLRVFASVGIPLKHRNADSQATFGQPDKKTVDLYTLTNSMVLSRILITAALWFPEGSR